MHVEAEKSKNLLFNLAYADSEGTPGRSCFLYLLHEQLKSLEGMPVTPFVMGGLNGAAAIGRRKNLQFLQPGADTYPRSNKFFTIMSSGCALLPLSLAPAASERPSVPSQAGHREDAGRVPGRHPYFENRRVVVRRSPRAGGPRACLPPRAEGEGVTGHFISDFSPSFIYEMGEKEKFLNHFTCFSDEFVALLQLMKSPLSRHDRRCLLQAWDGGKPLDKLDTVRGARARASNAQPLTSCASRR